MNTDLPETGEPADVIIVGAGPNGLMLATELCLAGVRPVVLEQLAQPSVAPKANGLVGQVVPLLDRRGLYQRFTGNPGPPAPTPVFMFGGMPLVFGDWDRNPMCVLPLPQADLERGLRERALELGVDIRRDRRVTGLTQDADGVTLQVTGSAGEETLRARFVVGCDGGHSTVRAAAGIGFPGLTNTALTSRNANVTLPAELLRPDTGELEVPGVGRFTPFTFHRTERGVFVHAAFKPGRHMVTTMEWDGAEVDDEQDMTLAEMRESVRRVLGVDVPFDPPTGPGPHLLRRQVGRNTRQADRYRAGRVLVAGDAAHVHSGVGGPGLNLGLQDVVNLAWKLAAQIRGWAPAGLLDTYHDERYPVGERVVMHSQAQTTLLSPGGDVTALRALFGELLGDPANVRRIGNLMAGADIHYGGGEGPVGRWVRDFPLTVEGRATRLAELAHDARPLLLDLTGDPRLAEVAAGWADRVDTIVAEATDAPAAALLIRPDGYAAWAAEADPDTWPESLAEALVTWFGQPVSTGVAATVRQGV